MVECPGHLTRRSDGVTEVGALGIPPADWTVFLSQEIDEAALNTIRRGERTGKPPGNPTLVARIEAATAVCPMPGGRGRERRRK